VRLTYPTAMVLFALSRGYAHGFDVIDATGLGAGTVYPILRRLDAEGLVISSWEPAEAVRPHGRPPRRNYLLTPPGERAAREALERYPALARLLQPAGGDEPATA
jgi:PadR family transcriptional regulator, regulatory protein PadR